MCLSLSSVGLCCIENCYTGFFSIHGTLRFFSRITFPLFRRTFPTVWSLIMIHVHIDSIEGLVVVVRALYNIAGHAVSLQVIEFYMIEKCCLCTWKLVWPEPFFLLSHQSAIVKLFQNCRIYYNIACRNTMFHWDDNHFGFSLIVFSLTFTSLCVYDFFVGNQPCVDRKETPKQRVCERTSSKRPHTWWSHHWWLSTLVNCWKCFEDATSRRISHSKKCTMHIRGQLCIGNDVVQRHGHSQNKHRTNLRPHWTKWKEVCSTIQTGTGITTSRS